MADGQLRNQAADQLNLTLSPKARQVLGTIAPLLGTALGGPLGTAAGALIATALNVKPGDSNAAETALLTATPDQLLALKKAHEEFVVQMRSLGVQEHQLQYEDIASARARQIAVKDNTPQILAYLIISGTGLAIAATLAGLTKVDSALAGTLIGYLIAESRSALAFYFGSSAASRQKDATLAKIAESNGE